MSEKQFHIERDSTGTFTFFYDGKHKLYDEEVVNLLNKQTVEIQKLIKERNLYKSQIKSKNDKIERLQRENNKCQVHYKYDVKHLKEENERLKQQLFYDGDDVCDICKHEYLVPSGNYFIGKCEKGHEECSTEDIEYCEDFNLKELSEWAND